MVRDLFTLGAIQFRKMLERMADGVLRILPKTVDRVHVAPTDAFPAPPAGLMSTNKWIRRIV